MSNCKSFLVTEAERKHVRRLARFQQHGYASCYQVPPSLQGKSPKEIHAILIETLGEHAQSYATAKSGWPSLNVVIFPPVMRLVLDDPKVTTPEITDQIHKVILEGSRISAKSIAEHLGISRERFGSVIHEHFDMWKLFAKWVPKCLNADQKRQRYQSSE